VNKPKILIALSVNDRIIWRAFGELDPKYACRISDAMASEIASCTVNAVESIVTMGASAPAPARTSKKK